VSAVRWPKGRPSPWARLILLALAVLAVPAAALTAWIAWPLPPDLADPSPVAGLTLLDSHDIPLRAARAPDGSRGGWMELSEIDPDLIRAVLAVEDERYYAHSGIDLRAIGRATRDNFRAGRIVSGASTITMQTARLLRDIPHSWSGKLRQALWALRLEAQLDKQRILEIYLNRLPLGQGTIGVVAAAALYFDASAAQLSLGQAALLAALAHAPSRDNPLVAPPRAVTRRARVLERLGELGYAGREDIRRALQEPVLQRDRGVPFLAPHFTTRVLLWSEQRGEQAFGQARTTLDAALQERLEAEVRHTVSVLADRRVEQAAAIVLDNASGAIRAWVGSPDFWADSAGQVDMVVSRRQPGSALKPFLYGLAFDRGYTAATILPDVPTSYTTASGVYRPRNYDRRYHGPVRAREALASSYNIPAVELAQRLGPGSVLATLRRAGFASLEKGSEHYGVGLALGNGDVTLLELANAYRALANGGVWRPYRWLDSEANPEPSLAQKTDHPTVASGKAPRRVISESAAYLVLDILSDPVARLPGFGSTTPFDFPFPVAVKTGTSRRFTDNWAVGVTQGFTVAVWAGNFSGRPMAAVSGVTGAGPLLQRAVLATARSYRPLTLPRPADVGLIPAKVCRLSGQRAHAGCPGMMEWFRPDAAPTAECAWHQGGNTLLPAEYAEWADQQVAADWRQASATDAASVVSAGVGGLRIISPRDGDRYQIPPGADPRYATIALRVTGDSVRDEIRWLVDGIEVGAARWRLVPGEHSVRAETAAGDWDEVKIMVE